MIRHGKAARSNLMHGINGYVFGNLPGLVMQRGELVRWYVLGLGTEIESMRRTWTPA